MRWRAVRAVVAGVGLAVLVGCSVGEPAAQPSGSSPGSSTAPAATAPSTSTSTPIQLSTVTVDPRLPPASPLPAGLLAGTDGSWLVALVALADPSDPAARVYYLVSPEGARYELPGLGDVTLSQWLPGTPYALALRSTGTWTVEVQIVDLETARPVGGLDWPALYEALPTTTWLSVTLVGDMTTDVIVSLGTPDGGRVLRVAADGTVRASVDADWWDLDPAPGGGRLLAFERASSQVVEVDPDTLQVLGRPLDGACWPSWVDQTRWLARCQDGNETAWFLVGPAGVSQLPLVGEVSPLLALGDGSVLLTVEDWDGPALVGQRVVAVKNGAVEDVETPLAYVSGATSGALIGRPTTPGLRVDHLVVDLAAPLVGWRPADETTTPLVQAGQDGAAMVLPVGGPGSPSGGWLAVSDGGELEVPMD